MDTIEQEEAINVGHVDHICFAYKSLEKQEQARAEFSTLLGVNDWDMLHSPARKLRVIISWNAGIELIAPTGEGSSLEAFFAENPEGFYSFAFGVRDLDEATRELEGKGRIAKRTEGHPYLERTRFNVFRQSVVQGPVGGAKVIVTEHRGLKPNTTGQMFEVP